jgi:hypothetical protein
MNNLVLFVSHRRQLCGVHQFGKEVHGQISGSGRYRFIYVECESTDELLDAARSQSPAAIIFNYHPATMPWGPLAAAICARIPSVGIIHDATNEMADDWVGPLFWHFITHDPDLKTHNPLFSSAPRPLPRYRPAVLPPDHGPVRIGSFGFAAHDKGFDRLVQAVQGSFDECVIRLHIPTGDFPGAISRQEIVDSCQALIVKPGVRLEVSHEFLSRDELLDLLASNHLNALFYDPDRGMGGISSAADLALASGRPMALRRGNMFRCYNAAKPSIFVDDLPLHEILANGTQPLQAFTQSWSSQALVAAYEDAVARAIAAADVSSYDTDRRSASMLDVLWRKSEEHVCNLERRLSEMHGATVFLREYSQSVDRKLLEEQSRSNQLRDDVRLILSSRSFRLTRPLRDFTSYAKQTPTLRRLGATVFWILRRIKRITRPKRVSDSGF